MMKHFGMLAIIVIFCCIALVKPQAVWSEKTEEAPSKTSPGNLSEGDETNAARGVKSSHEESRTSFKKDVQKTLRDLDRKISALGKQARQTGAMAKTESQEVWEDLKLKQKTAKKELKKIPGAGREAWESTKSHVNSALEDLKQSYDKAVSYFK